MSSYIECGRIVNTHGCRGGVKIESWCDTPEILSSMSRVFVQKGSEYREYRVKRSSVFRQFVLMELSGIEDMDTAMALKNTVLWADREDFHLPEGTYFIADLIGVPVLDADSNEVLGHVTELINRGAQDIYVVETPQGERMIPAVDEFVVSVSVKDGLRVRPISGMLD